MLQRLAVILELAERRESHAPGNAMEPVGHKTQQVPSHAVKAQGGTAEQPSYEEIIRIGGEDVNDAASPRRRGEMSKVAPGFETCPAARHVRLCAPDDDRTQRHASCQSRRQA